MMSMSPKAASFRFTAATYDAILGISIFMLPPTYISSCCWCGDVGCCSWEGLVLLDIVPRIRMESKLTHTYTQIYIFLSIITNPVAVLLSRRPRRRIR
ncbi:hypothetical protein F5Y14DRAFT_101728 [Nemania sp. NC0429]|nr:hypothetical protein F5Y14DRAFT_101728 [Nemania sp. NC0429]